MYPNSKEPRFVAGCFVQVNFPPPQVKEVVLRNRRNTSILWIVLLVVIVAGIGLLGWQNYRYALENRGGNDFLVYWESTRMFLMDGTNPYGDEVTARTQLQAYGGPAETGQPTLRMVYPLYSIALFFPFALIPEFTTARAVYNTLLEICLLLLLFFSIRLVRWRISPLEFVLYLALVLFGFHSIQPLIDGNVAILVAMLIAAALLALKNGGDALAGILLALTTIKPNVVVLLLAYLMIWSLVSGRRTLAAYLSASVFILSLAAMLLMPDWIWQNLIAVVQFPLSDPPATLGAVITFSFPAMGVRIARIMYGVLVGMLVTEWWVNRRAEFRGMLWTALFTLTISQWVGVPTSPTNFVVLLPATALVFATWEERWRRMGHALTVISILGLGIGIWFLRLSTAAFGPTQTLNPLLFLPLPAFLIITLYWVRWWAIQPPNVWFDWISMPDQR